MSPNRPNDIVCVGIFLVIFLRIASSQQAEESHRFDLRSGICYTEVPTYDLLTDQQRRGPIPRGNGSSPSLSRIQSCCSGWIRKPGYRLECEPYCELGCEHGICMGGNECRCNQDYVKDHKGVCIPTCPLSCPHGRCTSFNDCWCDIQYEESRDKKYCIPKCWQGCGEGGYCAAPDKCECHRGYVLNSRRKCERDVYVSTPSYCSRGCRNGDCVGTNTCRCRPGWNLDRTGTICEPHCSDMCLNGECVGPNTCRCKSGYVNDSRSPNRCVANCPGGCPNGTCSGPNFCLCNPGFRKERSGSNYCIRSY